MSFFKRFCRAASNLPGLNIDAKLLIIKPPKGKKPLDLNEAEKYLSPEICSTLVPDNILRLTPRLERQRLLEEAFNKSRHVMLVDGTMAQLPNNNRRLRPRTQLKTEQKRGNQISVFRMRTRERIFGEILSIINFSVHNPYLRLPFWRITRVEQSPDYQHCVVRWTIDEESDYQHYQANIEAALAQSASTVRFELAKRLSLRIAPIIRFTYEDYTAIRLAETLDELPSPT